MLEALFACSGAVFERDSSTSTLDCAEIVLRGSAGLILAWTLLTRFGNGGRTVSREAEGLNLLAIVRYSKA